MTKLALVRSIVSNLALSASFVVAVPALAATTPKHHKSAAAARCYDTKGKAIASATPSTCTAPNQWIVTKSSKHVASAKKPKQGHVASIPTKDSKN
jgi:hypothetical protein